MSECDSRLRLPTRLVGTGNTQLFQKIGEKCYERQPRDTEGNTPFIYAAQNGHFETCEIIIKSIEDKNPGDNDGWSPLHKGAKCPIFVQFCTNKQGSKMFGVSDQS